MDKPTREQQKSLYIRLLLRAVILAAALLLLKYALPQLLSLFAPFILAYLMALALDPLVSLVHKRFGFPRKLTAIILVILLFLSLAALIVWFIYTIVSEAVSLAGNIQSIWDSMTLAFNIINARLVWLLDFMPSGTETILANVNDGLFQWLQDVSGDFVNSIVSRTAAVTTKVGSVLIGVIVFIMAAYLITAEHRTIGDLTRKYLGDRVYDRFKVIKASFRSAVGGYLKAQLLLSLLAFGVMLIALAVYGQGYAYLIALLLAIIDFLPILGTAVVLVPWGLIEMAGGDFVKGIFLCALSGGFFVLRKLVEPRIVGSQTGLHPLAALMSIFVGMKIIGIWGAVFGPIALMIAVSVVKSHVFDSTVADVREAFGDLAQLLRRA